jgi:ABC-type nitrate/sulfonate/bicarbonate transport system substrate-binding protein
MFVLSKRVRMMVLLTVLVSLFSLPAAAQGPAKATMTYDEATQCLAQQFPVEKYATNDYLPGPDWKPGTYATPKHLKVGGPWISNDERAQEYIAIEMGYFKQAGLDVELVPGGPGIDHLTTLAGGAVDVAISSGAKYIPKALTSPTPLDVVAVGTLLKGMPLGFLAVDDKYLGRKLTPADLKGTTIAVQPGADDYVYAFGDKNGVPRDSMTLIDGGFTPDSIMVGKAQFYTAWIMNQPRLVEQAGKKWNFMFFSEYAYNEFGDVVCVRRDTMSTPDGQDWVRRYLWALKQSTQFLLDNPDKAADITLKYVDSELKLTKEQVLWRFDHQKDLITGTDKNGLLYMDPAYWTGMTATLLQYGQIPLQCKK